MGFGESVGPVEGLTLHDNARDVAVAIEKTSAAPAIIAGWAYGNRVARMLAIDRPELVRGVVLIAAGGKFPPKPEVMTELRAFQDKSLSLEKHCSTRRQCLVTDSGNS
jgi:pimeloyl-ACP methyl ester carboxylesterase